MNSNVFQRRSGSDKGDVQILSLDGDSRRGETFRREGDAEILELERQEHDASYDDNNDIDDDDEMEVTSLNEEGDIRRHRYDMNIMIVLILACSYCWRYRCRQHISLDAIERSLY